MQAVTIRPSGSHMVWGLLILLAIGRHSLAQNRPVVDDGTVTETHRQATISAPERGFTKASKPNNRVLVIETDKPDAQVKIDGVSKGQTTNGELKLELPAGRRYKVEVIAGPDYLPHEEVIVLTTMRVVKAPLQSRFGTVRIGPRFPDGAKVLVDGQPLSPDQVQVDQDSDLLVISRLAQGTRKIEYDHPDYVIVEHSFKITPGSDLTWTFHPARAEDDLLVETDPGASVYVDGKHYDETASDGKLKVIVPLGKHEVKLEKYGFSQQKAELEFKFGDPVPLKRALVPLPNSAEFHEDFEISEAFKNRWFTPSSGWKLEKGRLYVENCPALLYPRAYNYNDFKASFHLKLENGGGAAWALRVKDSSNYYLFYVTGPDAPNANRFLTYIVRDNKFDPGKPDDSVPLSLRLEANEQYDVEIIATGNEIDSFMTSSKTGRRLPSGVIKDNDNFFPYGTIGFRTIGSERFSVDDLFVRPPMVKPESGLSGQGKQSGEISRFVEDLWRRL